MGLIPGNGVQLFLGRDLFYNLRFPRFCGMPFFHFAAEYVQRSLISGGELCRHMDCRGIIAVSSVFRHLKYAGNQPICLSAAFSPAYLPLCLSLTDFNDISKNSLFSSEAFPSAIQANPVSTPKKVKTLLSLWHGNLIADSLNSQQLLL